MGFCRRFSGGLFGFLCCRIGGIIVGSLFSVDFGFGGGKGRCSNRSGSMFFVSGIRPDGVLDFIFFLFYWFVLVLFSVLVLVGGRMLVPHRTRVGTTRELLG